MKRLERAVTTCFGDSGGPLVADDPSANPVEIGISSMGSECNPARPAYFARLDFMSNWISSWIAQLAPPTIVSRPPSHVGQFSARVNGSVNPNGAATKYRFQYGTTTTYGTTPGPSSTNDGQGTLDVYAKLTGLAPATTYHYRLVGSSANGIGYGRDESFTTAPAPLAGRYQGKTSQRKPIHFRVLASRAGIQSLFFGFTVSQQPHRRGVLVLKVAVGRSILRRVATEVATRRPGCSGVPVVLGRRCGSGSRGSDECGLALLLVRVPYR
jgi:hypothetical protein